MTIQIGNYYKNTRTNDMLHPVASGITTQFGLVFFVEYYSSRNDSLRIVNLAPSEELRDTWTETNATDYNNQVSCAPVETAKPRPITS